jgi:hypothetical protein
MVPSEEKPERKDGACRITKGTESGYEVARLEKWLEAIPEQVQAKKRDR